MTSLKHLKDRITQGKWKAHKTHPLSENTWYVIVDQNGRGPITDVGGVDLPMQISEQKHLVTDPEEIKANAEAIALIPDLLQLCEDMKEALYKIKTKPCLACGCSAGSHAEDGRCPEFFNGQLYGWANTFFIAENAMPEIDSALNKYNELFK